MFKEQPDPIKELAEKIIYLENKYIKLPQLGDDRMYKIPNFLQVKINNE